MSISVRTNVSSLTAQSNLGKTSADLQKSISRLSSGLRVESAADDAAGLAISEDFKASIRSLDQARRNANDGVSMIQTADGSLKEIGGLLTRMRELSVQARNGTVNTQQRGYLNDEFGQLRSEIDRIVNTTEFNGVDLLDGSQAGGLDFQVGKDTSTDDRLTMSIATSSASALGVSASTISSTSGADSAITALDTAIQSISTRRAGLGAMQNRLSTTMSNLDTYSTNLAAANSRIVDVDVASETASLTKNQILMQAGTAMLAQANQGPQSALQLLG
ncbi:MAG: flagellin FliC [Deltaproteobacteria bacterium]|nr:flagellin FliC [Deltaproteobacteria bacterium]MBK8718707.1 flagellin FliC [Deltaproteobacteria bacterium]MBP7290976.1 flagellin FliC [Nannocystaceae bacterium]